MSEIVNLTCVFLLIPFYCIAIYFPGDEVTKPPTQWVGLPWPKRSHHGRHASLGWRMSNGDGVNLGTIDHITVAEDQSRNEEQQSEVKWEIVPDPTRTGGFKMVRVYGNEEEEDIPSEELDFNRPGLVQDNLQQQQQIEILSSSISRGDSAGKGSNTHQQYPSVETLTSGMSFGDSIGREISSANNQQPSLDVLASSLTFGDSNGRGIPPLTNQHPSLHDLTSGMSYGDSTGREVPSGINQFSSVDVLASAMTYGSNNGRDVLSIGHVREENTHSSNLAFGSVPAQKPALWNEELESENLGNFDNANMPDEIQKLDSAYNVGITRRDLAASSTALLKATCPPGATGQFVYLQDCRRFLNCWKGRGFVQACAPGTLFNPDTLECDFPVKVKCLNVSHIHDGREGRTLSNAEKPVENSRPQHHKVSGCPMPGGTGLAPHPTDCAKFLNCWNGFPHIQNCAPGTLFNAQTLICDFPYNVICNAVSAQSQTIDTAEIQQGSAEKYQEPFEPRRSYCTMEGGSGVVPHPTDCAKYISCWKGVAHTQSCGPGTLFNQQTLQCDFPHNVNCTLLQQSDENAPSKPSPNKPLPGIPSIIPFTTTRRTTSKTTTTTTTTSTTTSTTSTTSTTTTTTTPPPTVTPSITAPPLSSQSSEGVNGSGQVLRLRGGPSPWEGYVEIQKSVPGWGLVCDETNKWTILEANVVCFQLGYERGAELSWQGRPIQSTEDTQRIAVSKVSCIGTEPSLSSCQLLENSRCIIARDAVGVRCYRNWISQCRPKEVNHKGHCYELIVPNEHHSTLGFTHAEAMQDCQSHGGHLLDINTQDENNFISEWLIQLQPNITNILTAGVGVSITKRTIWIWEGSNTPINFNKWWPGWTGEHGEAPVIGQHPLCIVAKRVFPCELAYYTNYPVTDIHSHHHDAANMRLCATNYFYWDTEDCSITHSHPYICERPIDDIGCLPKNGRTYLGTANVTVSGSACQPWDDPSIVSKLGYRVSRRERLANLSGHNHCRYIGSSSHPWCYVDKQGKKEDCDIPSCWSNAFEKAVSLTVFGCGTNEYECKPGECIPRKLKCNGIKDCSNGYDEQDCWAEMLNLFSKHTNRRLRGHVREKWMKTNVGTCARYCIESKGFTCRSFSHNEKQNECLLSDSNVGLSGNVVQEQNWQYFEVIAHSIQCKNNRFECDNGKCINMSQICNGKNECGDKSDEKNCSAEFLGYGIRLAGSNVSNEGRIEVKVFGKWGVICDDFFAMRNAEVACRELGFHLGAVEVLPPGSYSSSRILPFMMDDLKCIGNETSLRECDFQGWGIHDCLPDEAVSIVCSVPGQTCPLNQWQCKTSKECIPVIYLCDNIDDCDDASDEDTIQCNAVEVRLSGGSSNMEGRVEVKYHGLWGTLCDDDFSASTAKVICRSLGFGGAAEAKKDAAYGPGEGQIWLDQIHCSGNETSITQCLHSPWGEHNCHHSEDASVVCSHGDTRHSEFSHTMEIAPRSDDVIQMNSILPGQCGKRSIEEVEYEHIARVVGGNEVPKGSYPWQASIRVRNGEKSVHWCGAVVLSPLHILTAGHCMVDYTKGMYFIRVGDHDTEDMEEFEQELNIDQIYMHEQFNKEVRLNNDIALVKLKGLGMQLGNTVQPICLPEPGITYSAGLNCTVSGWGSLKTAGAGYSRRLRAAWLPILPSETCSAGFVYGKKSIGEGMFCAGQLEGGIDSCQGDSGGPFVCYINDGFVLFGITSWGHGCGRPNKPGVYSNVSYYREWIDQKLIDSMSGH